MADVVSDYRTEVVKRSEMKAVGILVVGTLDDLLKIVDIVVDYTPKYIVAKNKKLFLRIHSYEYRNRCVRGAEATGRRRPLVSPGSAGSIVGGGKTLFCPEQCCS